MSRLFDLFITFIFIIKILFVICAVWHSYLVKKNEKEGNHTNLKMINSLEYWKERLEFIFIFCMSFVCIYVFNPFSKNFVVDKETKLLLFVFGIIILINANWNIFFKKAKWFTEFQNIIGKVSR